MTPGQLGSLGFLWLVAAAIASGFAKLHGWGQWKWYFASLAIGPVAWLALYFKHRDMRERIGPPNPRSQFLRRPSPGDHSKRVT